MKTIIRLLIASLAFLCLSLAGPETQAVVPPPDGGYPNFNTAEGQNALFSLTTGAANTAVGWFSLSSDTTGSNGQACEICYDEAGNVIHNSCDQVVWNSARWVSAW